MPKCGDCGRECFESYADAEDLYADGRGPSGHEFLVSSCCGGAVIQERECRTCGIPFYPTSSGHGRHHCRTCIFSKAHRWEEADARLDWRKQEGRWQ